MLQNDGGKYIANIIILFPIACSRFFCSGKNKSERKKTRTHFSILFVSHKQRIERCPKGNSINFSDALYRILCRPSILPWSMCCECKQTDTAWPDFSYALASNRIKKCFVYVLLFAFLATINSKLVKYFQQHFAAKIKISSKVALRRIPDRNIMEIYAKHSPVCITSIYKLPIENSVCV